MRRCMLAFALAALLALAGGDAFACFGAMLKVAVVPGRAEVASYALGFFVEEKTGVAPEFVEVADAAAALASGAADVALLDGKAIPPKGASKGPALSVLGLEGAAVWLRDEVKDDLRFTTVERALTLLPGFYASSAYKNAVSAGKEPKKAARKAVSDGS